VKDINNKMPTHLSKTRKHRGHVSAGHGRVGKQYAFPFAKHRSMNVSSNICIAESIPVDVVLPVVNIIIEPTWTNTSES
jgi:hypothetical protein